MQLIVDRLFILFFVFLSFNFTACSKGGGNAPGDFSSQAPVTPAPIPFDPTQISNILSWYDAADASSMVVASGAVSSWKDKANNGFEMLNANPAQQPLYSTSAINGKSTLHFDGVDDFMSASVAQPISSNVTVSYVVRPEKINVVIPFTFINRTYSGNGPDVYFNSGHMHWNTGDSDANPFLNSVYPALNQVHIITVTNDKVNSITKLYVDGIYVGSAAYRETGETDLSVPRIKIGNWSSGVYYLKGDFAELVIYNKVLQATELDQIHSYLKTKWAVP